MDFGASPLAYTISGSITDVGIGVGGVSVQAGNQTTNTDANGNYVLSGLCPGSYTVIPAQACRLFTPSSIPVVLGPNTGGVNFVTFSNDLSRIRGQITDGVNGLSNVLVTAAGGGTAITDVNGNYSFSSLCPGTYTVAPLVTNRCLGYLVADSHAWFRPNHQWGELCRYSRPILHQRDLGGDARRAGCCCQRRWSHRHQHFVHCERSLRHL